MEQEGFDLSDGEKKSLEELANGNKTTDQIIEEIEQQIEEIKQRISEGPNINERTISKKQ